ncbi:MAG: HAMP domain-containing sensor histidine kinase [Actinomycetota bacterium]
MSRGTITRRAAIGIAAVTTFHFAWLTLKIGGDTGVQAFSDLIGIPASLVPAAACFWLARSAAPTSRRAWRYLGLAIASWGVGEIIWTYYELALHQEVPFPSLADAGFLGVIPFGALAILSFPTAPKRASTRARALLDGLIIAGSILFIGWAIVLGPAYEAGKGGSIIVQLISVAYPLGDLVLISAVLFVFSHAQSKERTALGLISLGLVAVSVADFGFTYLTLNELYSTGSFIDPLWNLGFMLIGLAALRRPEFAETTIDERRIGALTIAGPYVPFLAALGVAGIVQITQGGLPPFLFWTAAINVAFVVARQMIALLDNMGLNKDLEGRVCERTAELEQALVDLEESQRLQEEFVANTTHELFTPLTVIMASLETLSFTDDDRFVAEQVDMAHQASLRMKRLIEDVLLTSGVATWLECERDPMDLEIEVRAALQEFTPTDKVLELAFQDPVTALGDAERLRIIVQQLVTNADKFSPPGSAIRIEAFRYGYEAHLVVHDEGPGIPQEHRENVFRRFYQIDGSDTRKHGGVGLGLFLAKHLATGMGGTLDVDDTPAGAAVHLVLPAAHAAPSCEEIDGMVVVPITPASNERKVGAA